MNNKIAIAIVAIVIIAGGAFLFTRNKADDSSTVDSNTEVTAEADSEASIETGSIESLLAAGKSQICTFSSNEQDAETSGIVYVSGGKMRGDFAIDAKGTMTFSHMIYDGTMSYVWSDGSNAGFKMALDADAQSSTSSRGIDPKKNYEYRCEKWSADNSKFELPTGIKFSEIPTTMTGRPDDASSSIDNKEMQQAICNNLPEPGKTQCLSGIY
jgi:hypothetical protein